MGIRARGKQWLIDDVLTHRLAEIDPEGPKIVEGLRAVTLGLYSIDYVARTADGGLTIVTFAVSAFRDALGQMILNPHAVRSVLDGRAPMRSVLVATHVDWFVVELVKKISAPTPLIIRLARELDGGDDYELVTPTAPDGLGRHTQCSDRTLGPQAARERQVLATLMKP